MRFAFAAAGVLAAAALAAPTSIAQAPAPLAVGSAKITVEGTTNVHGYTAETTDVQLVTARVGAFDGDLWTLVETPSLVEAFEIVIPSASLHSTKDGIDKNMHKALKAAEHPTITFRMKSLESKGASGVHAVGVLTIAGVSKDVAFDLTAARSASGVSLTGALPLMMTDYGVKPPKAMMGMMRTDPKVTLSIEIALTPRAS